MLASRVGILDSLRPFADSPDVGNDLEQIARFFGIGVTSRTMAELTGTTPATLSRLHRGHVISPRQERHIAVLAALSIEMEKHLAETGQTVDPDGRYRWLEAGRLDLAPDRHMRPIEALKDPDLLMIALEEVRTARALFRLGKAGS